tara:strand:- start:1603 stop:2238 length:636 start_codon:yes stop_codon:yes gene_type:complete
MREKMIVVPAGKFCCHSHLMEFVKEPSVVKAGTEKREKAKNQKKKDNYLPFQLEHTRKRLNELIILLDDNFNCICCGLPSDTYHAGHYRSVGGNAHMRFWAFNIHKQSAGCNLKTKWKKATEASMEKDYRKGLIGRYGLEYVEAIEGDWPLTNPTCQDLIDFRKLIAIEKKNLLGGNPAIFDWRRIPSKSEKPWKVVILSSQQPQMGSGEI